MKKRSRRLQGNAAILILFVIIASIFLAGIFSGVKTRNPTQGIVVKTVPGNANTSLQLNGMKFITVTPQPTALPQTGTGTTTGLATGGLQVSGNKLTNAQGQQVTLHGVDFSGSEYMCVQGTNQVFDGPVTAASVQAMKAWKIDVVRIPLNEDCWLGINGANPGGAAYQQAIKNYVRLLTQNGMYAIVELHWNAPGNMLATGQQNMADADHSPTFWTSVAQTFSGNSTVIFDLYNEPHDISWACWKSGCGTMAGMQQLINAVRGTGATNIIMLGGLDYANDLSGWLANKPTDPQNRLVASFHMYGKNACQDINCWNQTIAPVIAQAPLIAGEFGESYDDSICATTTSNAFMNWMDQHNSGYLAWVWNTWGTACGNLSLITNFDGTPHDPNGTNYKAHIANF